MDSVLRLEALFNRNIKQIDKNSFKIVEKFQLFTIESVEALKYFIGNSILIYQATYFYQKTKKSLRK